MNFTRALVVAGTVAALAAPAAAVAKKGGAEKHKNSHSLEAKSKGKGKAKGKSKPKTFNFKGAVSAVEGDVVTVLVKQANSRGRSAKSKPVAFDLSGARLKVADTNGDGATNAADVKVGDRVSVQARLPQNVDLAAGPHAARKLVDLTAPPADDDSDEARALPRRSPHPLRSIVKAPASPGPSPFQVESRNSTIRVPISSPRSSWRKCAAPSIATCSPAPGIRSQNT